MKKKKKNILYNNGFIKYIVGLFILGGITCFLLDRPGSNHFDYTEQDEPGYDRYFVPIRIDIADSLFKNKLKANTNINESLYIIHTSDLKNYLRNVDMGNDIVWEKLKHIDENVSLSLSKNELTLRLDKLEGEKVVYIPAGLMRGLIE